MLRLNEVHSFYGNSHILRGINLGIHSGSIAALVGRNGMGKSTTINTIMSLQPCRSGKIIFKGLDITGLQTYKIARMGVALVPQGRRIFPSLTVKENLLMGCKNNNFIVSDLEALYQLFPILKIRTDQKAGSLSGGEQEMLCIGRALLSRPDLVLMDEPFEGLAPAIVNVLMTKLAELRNDGLSILLVEQNVKAAMEIADYFFVMEKGQIVFEGNPRQTEYAEIKKFIMSC